MSARVRQTLPLRDAVTISRMVDTEERDAERMARHLGLKSSTFGHSRSHGGGAAQKPVGKGKTDVNSVVRGDLSKGTRTVDLESTRGFKRAFKVRIGTGKNAEERWVIDLAGTAGPS